VHHRVTYLYSGGEPAEQYPAGSLFEDRHDDVELATVTHCGMHGCGELARKVLGHRTHFIDPVTEDNEGVWPEYFIRRLVAR
jgi:hypothetical protein